MGRLRLGGIRVYLTFSPLSKLIIVPTLDFDHSEILHGVGSVPPTSGRSVILPRVRSIPPTTGQSVILPKIRPVPPPRVKVYLGSSSKGFAFRLGLVP